MIDGLSPEGSAVVESLREQRDNYLLQASNSWGLQRRMARMIGDVLDNIQVGVMEKMIDHKRENLRNG